ncbi:septation protein SepH [Cellulomonas timonensis]|uniref:septation protein SepH n=1 Tax=Cellulomonas timonensis TaxID=1689271 RepID=UPI00082FED61|nr:septation protein SepH [Cellulomonas timonensis]
MGELELVGLHDDGEHLVLATSDGQRFRLRIDEPLRAAVRRDRPQLEQLRSTQAGALTPREIQRSIRAGRTAQEVADEAGLPVEHVRRYEGPVLAERAFIADQARATRVGRDAGAPELGDLVTDRLAARGVALATLAWDAHRDQSGPWVVVARFTVGDGPREARWTFDPAKRVVQADEDEARWLSETEIADEPIARRHLAAVRDVVFDVEADGTLRPAAGAAAEPEPEDKTAALLDDLSSRRGVRQQLDLEDDEEEWEGFGPPHAFDFEASVPGAHPVDAEPAAEAKVLAPVPVPAGDVPALPALTSGAAGQERSARPGRSAGTPAAERASSATSSERDAHPAGSRRTTPEAPPAALAQDDAPVAERPRARKGRAKVPSWDEIVFGAKPE